MKKYFFSLLITFLAVGHAQAETKALCSLIFSKKIVKLAKAHSKNDKNRHCSVSCMLTLKCPSADVLAIGALKEIKDVFGPGNAEVADLKADLLGIALAQTHAAKTKTQCLSQCDLYYSP